MANVDLKASNSTSTNLHFIKRMVYNSKKLIIIEFILNMS